MNLVLYIAFKCLRLIEIARQYAKLVLKLIYILYIPIRKFFSSNEKLHLKLVYKFKFKFESFAYSMH